MWGGAGARERERERFGSFCAFGARGFFVGAGSNASLAARCAVVVLVHGRPQTFGDNLVLDQVRNKRAFNNIQAHTIYKTFTVPLQCTMMVIDPPSFGPFDGHSVHPLRRGERYAVCFVMLS